MPETHPLDGAYQRIQRANFHIYELKGVIQFFANAVKNKIVAYDELLASQLRLKHGDRIGGMKRTVETPFVVPQFPIIFGEAIYNLRSSLDYLVYELSRHRSGTQFPIEDEKLSEDGKRGFDTRRKTFLKGVSREHVGAIEALQPYRGCTWTKTLREASNPDKHRHLTILLGQWSTSQSIECGASGSFRNRSGKVIQATSRPDTELHIDFEHALEIHFPDRSPVLETLSILSRNVMATIDSFKPEFKD